MNETLKPAAKHTQVGIWGTDNKVLFEALDLTESNRIFWRKAMTVTLEMESTLRDEIPQTFKILNERIRAESNIENIFRWLYVRQCRHEVGIIGKKKIKYS